MLRREEVVEPSRPMFYLTSNNHTLILFSIASFGFQATGGKVLNQVSILTLRGSLFVAAKSNSVNILRRISHLRISSSLYQQHEARTIIRQETAWEFLVLLSWVWILVLLSIKLTVLFTGLQCNVVGWHPHAECLLFEQFGYQGCLAVNCQCQMLAPNGGQCNAVIHLMQCLEAI